MADPPEDKVDLQRAYYLVGSFMSHWSILEATLDSAIAKALRIGNLEALVLNFNLELRSKINIMKSVVNLYCEVDEEWHEQAAKDIEAIAKLSLDRNIVAHVVFGPNDEETAVEFLVVRARSKLRFPPMIWEPPVFGEKIMEMMWLTDRLKEIADYLHERVRKIEALKQADQTNYLMHLLQGFPDSDPATPETEGESAQPPQEKPERGAG